MTTSRRLEGIEPLAAAIASDGPPYERALAATSLGRHLEELQQEPDPSGRVKSALDALESTTPIQDALLELVGYASRQQRLWQLWARTIPNKKTNAIPDGVDLTVSDAKKMRQNCAAVLAMLIAFLSATDTRPENSPPLQDMNRVPESVAASANIMRQTISREARRATEAPKPNANNRKPAGITTKSSCSKMPLTNMTAAAAGDFRYLSLVNSASAPDVGVDAHVKAALSSPIQYQAEVNSSEARNYIASLERYPTSPTTTTRLYDHARTAARPGHHRGYLRKVDGGYRTPLERIEDHRPAVMYLNDSRSLPDLSGKSRSLANAQLGYQIGQLLVPNERPLLAPHHGSNLGLTPRAKNSLERAQRQVTPTAVLQEHCEVFFFVVRATIFAGNITAFSAYAGMAALDPKHPRTRQILSMFQDASLTGGKEILPAIPRSPHSPTITVRGAVNASEGNQEFAREKTRDDVQAPVEPPDLSLPRGEAYPETCITVDAPLAVLTGPAALNQASPLSPVSPDDVRRAVSWSPRVGARQPKKSDSRGTTSCSSSSTGRRNVISNPLNSLEVRCSFDSYDAREARRTPITNFSPAQSMAVDDHALRSGTVSSLPSAVELHGGFDAVRKRVDDAIEVQERFGEGSSDTLGNCGDCATKRVSTRVSAANILEARAEQKEVTMQLQQAARDAKIAWRDARKHSILQGRTVDQIIPCNVPQDIPMTRVAQATNMAQLAEEKLANSLLSENHELIKANVSALPLRMFARFATFLNRGGPSDEENRLLVAISVRKRLRLIFGRWIEEFEKAQLSVALGLWRIGVWEDRRLVTWAGYRQKAAVAKLSAFLSTRRRRSITRAFARLVSRVGWLIFVERAGATLRIQTAYRQLCAHRLFVARHDAKAIDGAYADVALAEKRDVRFSIDARVRLERRGLWAMAITIQTRQRRNAARGHYMHARRTAIKFVSIFRMWPVRRKYLRMRDCAILMQASILMFIVRHPYLRIYMATCVAQRIVRGHKGRMRAYDKLCAQRRAVERRMSAPRLIQQCWRGLVGRRRVSSINAEMTREHWAGLRLQFAWYKKKNHFSTFLLLSCLRVSDEEDQRYAESVQVCIRKMAAKRISIYYAKHLKRVRRGAALRIASCWRRFQSISEVLGMRKSRWARRKLQNFVRMRMKLRHTCSRRIAFFWWRAKRGRFLRHLERALVATEKAEEEEDRRIRNTAAATIQAIIHGQLTRNWMRRELAILAILMQCRMKLAHLRVRRKRAEKRTSFVHKLVSRPIRDALFVQLNTYRRKLHAHATRIQASVRGQLTRFVMRLAGRYARSISIAALTLQRAARRRSRYMAALRALNFARRKMKSRFKACECFEEVLTELRKCSNIPSATQNPWLWYDIDDGWIGVGPHAACRRAGYVDAAPIGRKTLQALASHKKPRQQPHSGSTSSADISLEKISALARAIIITRCQVEGENNTASLAIEHKLLEECTALSDANGRRDAALLVCALKFAGLSQRQVDALPSPKDIGSLVKFEKLPFPCRKLVTAFSDENLYANGDAPRDLSRAMMQQFCSRFLDAEKALRALRSKELVKAPWVPNQAEIDHDTARVKHAFNIRRDALERLRLFLESRDPDFEQHSKLGGAIVRALAAGDAAINVANARSRDANKRRCDCELGGSQSDCDSISSLGLGSVSILKIRARSATRTRSSGSSTTKEVVQSDASSLSDGSAASPTTKQFSEDATTMSLRGDSESWRQTVRRTNTQRRLIARGECKSSKKLDTKINETNADVPGYVAQLKSEYPLSFFEHINLEKILTIIPGIERSEGSFALAVANTVFARALSLIEAYAVAAKRVSAAVKRRLSRRVKSATQHMHVVSKANSAYLQERSGAAVWAAWEADMKVYAEHKHAEELASIETKEQAQITRRLSTILRYGWFCSEIRKGQVQAALREPKDDTLDRALLVPIFERLRPRMPRPVHRNGVETYPKFRDDDEARDPGVPRVIMEPHEDVDDNTWEAKERERRRVPPLYDVEDDKASLVIQCAFRCRVALRWADKKRRDDMRRVREERDRQEWERRQQERSRFVTVRFALGMQQPDLLLKEKNDEPKQSAYNFDEPSLFEPVGFDRLERGLHVLARFGELDHWYAGTIFDDRRHDAFGVVFDDGDVDANVPRTRIKVPRISVGTRVEARYRDGDAYYEANVVEANWSFFKVRYDDGDVDACVPRAKLRVVDLESLLEVEAQHDRARARESRDRARQRARDERRRRDLASSQAELKVLRERFRAARAVSRGEEVMRQHRELSEHEMPHDPHALAMAEMAICAKKIRELMQPRVVVSVKIEYTRVELRYGWREVRDDQSMGATYYAHEFSGCTTWERPAFSFEDEMAARCVQRCYRLAARRRELDCALGSSHLPELITNTRVAAINAAWTPSGIGHAASDRIPLALWMSRRGFGTAAISSVLRVTNRQAKKVLSTSRHGKQTEDRRTSGNSNALARVQARALQRLRHLSGSTPRALDEGKKAETSADVKSNNSSNKVSKDKVRMSSLGQRLHLQQIKDEKYLDSLGLKDPADKNWLLTTNEDSARFVAYWNSPQDDRSMREVLENAKVAYLHELERHFKNAKTRCEHMAEALTKSRYPVTVAQLQRLAVDFPGKPAAAQEALKSRLLDVATTSTQHEELEALSVLKMGAQRVRELVERMQLPSLVARCDYALQAAEELCGSSNDDAGLASGKVAVVRAMQRTAGEMKKQQDSKHPPDETDPEMSGPAARACWILDDNVLGMVDTVLRGAVYVQTQCRQRLATRWYIEMLATRARAATTCQMIWRAAMARRMAQLYRMQQMADWQMIWDDSVQAFYFLHVSTAEVSWEEPAGGEASYRPQVKDRFTGRLMLAWPQLDHPKPFHLQQPMTGKCMLCKVEEATRRCLSCAVPTFEGRKPSWGDGYFYFCFACFAAHHETSLKLRSHEFEVTKDTTAPPLRCCVCSDLATRRCCGLTLKPRGRRIIRRFFMQHAVSAGRSDPNTSEKDDENIGHQLAALSATKLRSMLRQAEVPLSLARAEEIHEDCSVSSSGDRASQLASYHTILLEHLDKISAECNDYYCASCWSTSHAKGARAKHAWAGFAAAAPVCSLCEAAVATLFCETCGDMLCYDCSATAHTTLKQHSIVLVREPLDPADKSATHCECCDHREATDDCTLCGARLCDSCFLFEHDSSCSKRGGAKAIAMGVDVDYPTKCAVCGRRPDTRCVQCDEVFCTWMGKPRCFVKLHAKGKRRDHDLVPYTALADIEERIEKEEKEELQRRRAAEAQRTKAADDFEMALEQARRAKQQQDLLIDARADELLARRLLDEKLASRLEFGPGRWLLSLFRPSVLDGGRPNRSRTKFRRKGRPG